MVLHYKYILKVNFLVCSKKLITMWRWIMIFLMDCYVTTTKKSKAKVIVLFFLILKVFCWFFTASIISSNNSGLSCVKRSLGWKWL